MLAAYRERYCEPGQVGVAERPVKEPGPGEIRCRVVVTTVNRSDVALVTGRPAVMRLMAGLNRPRRPIPGTDFAGVVEKVGPQVTRFRVGDRVVGFEDNGCSSQAEFLILGPSAPVAHIPLGISYESAVAGMEGGHYAINFLNKVHLQAGQSALVYGASGAIGSALVQLLKPVGVRVTAVCGPDGLEAVGSLKPDDLLNHQETNLTDLPYRYDYIFDAVGKRTFGELKSLLKPGGIYISSELGPGGQNLFLPLITRIGGGRRVVFPFPSDIPHSLNLLCQELAAGRYHPLIDREYPISQVGSAYDYVASGRKLGSVLLRMSGEL
ncbi:MAG: NAD(P)-dependent alcohol dehydrogenase [Bacteroidetes bacterium]|nr:NAD(P)-dependent alcohol dehydrogenase [Bacteroidota bacterium]